jgi:transporter family protein
MCLLEVIILVFFLALFGMICWGLAPVFAKLGLSNVSPMAGLALRTYISTSFLTVWVLCSGTWHEFRDISKQATWLIAIEALLATLIGDFAYYAALKYGEVTFVTLVMACSPLVSIITAVFFLNEQITWCRLLGGILIISGIGFISFEGR